ncbi:hypothetical protein ACVIYL_001517 [Bradyrhizobium sp. USDA 3315]
MKESELFSFLRLATENGAHYDAMLTPCTLPLRAGLEHQHHRTLDVQPKGIHRGRDRGVTADVIDFPVKCHVGTHLLRHRRTACGYSACVEHSSKALEVCGRQLADLHACRSQPSRQTIQTSPNLIEIPNSIRTDGSDLDTHLASLSHEPALFEELKGVTDWGSGDAQAFGERCLPNTLARRQLAVHDLFDQPVVYRIGQKGRVSESMTQMIELLFCPYYWAPPERGIGIRYSRSERP